LKLAFSKVVKKISKSCQKVVKKCQKNVKKLSKSCQKVVKKLSKSCQKDVKKCQKKIVTWNKPNKNNGAIVEKVRWCNSKKPKKE
jgi:hypothetical protein